MFHKNDFLNSSINFEENEYMNINDDLSVFSGNLNWNIESFNTNENFVKNENSNFINFPQEQPKPINNIIIKCDGKNKFLGKKKKIIIQKESILNII